MLAYRLFIEVHSGKEVTKIFYNRILQCWVSHEGNVSPYFETEIAKFAYAIDVERHPAYDTLEDGRDIGERGIDA